MSQFMKKKYIILIIILFALVAFYVNRNVYYIDKWGIYIKIENNKSWKTDTTIVYFGNSRWHLKDNYIVYCPESAEMSSLSLHPIQDTIYAIEHNMEIVEIQSKDYNIKPVRLIWVDKVKSDKSDYWSDSTFIKEKNHDWISINHRHGVYKSWK